ncbi:acetylxylan esterase [Paraflavitalea soli]|uniref:Acetylxylan esterase n=1 Tax=Paraflavitalea soli TaxID=2315862 RepID=A0A3B7MIE3_9BACT|nr:acetylxylan esterase [Paraflavitalea soli]AXY72816.1 acetylxylan esterase [Paraflavitalea soli]
MFKKALSLIFVLYSVFTYAQPAEKLIKILITPDHADWQYKAGEKPRFTITVLKSNVPLQHVEVSWWVGPERMPALDSAREVLATGSKTIQAPAMTAPGFMRCTVKLKYDNQEYTNLATAGMDIGNLKPVAEEPKDFDQFWNQAIAANAKRPLDAKLTLMPERCTETVNVYHVSIAHYSYRTRLYGMLCIPKKEGKYPAILKVPSAGARPYYGDTALAAKGFITFEIGIHGIPVNMDMSVYYDLITGAISNYWMYNLDDRDQYYYKRVYLGCVRAIDFIYSLPGFDGNKLGVCGVSQGGALSIITAALDHRVKYLFSFFPALCDLTGYLHGRAGGWPHLFAPENLSFNNKKDKIATSAYYDVVNFAKRLKVPGFYSWGFNDETCPPTSMYAAYNAITAPKQLLSVPETGHWNYPEQATKAIDWLVEQMKK